MSNQDRFLQQSKQLLDDGVAQLDAATLSRLHQVRSAAVSRLQKRSFVADWLPAGVAASLALSVLVVTLWTPGTQIDTDLMTDADSEDLLRDIEFYEWLDVAEVDGDTLGSYSRQQEQRDV